MNKIKKIILTCVTYALAGGAVGVGTTYALIHPYSPINIAVDSESQLEKYQQEIEIEEAREKANQDALQIVEEIISSVGNENFTEKNRESYLD
ncbi:MAG: hypothetical protein PHS54_01655 [Clostridia bacterium]|nr:hypothetical protein [Clostridia bacterium]